MPSVSRDAIAANVRAYRKRQNEAGNRELTLNLPCEAVAYLDEIKKRQGLRNRSQALLQLMDQRRKGGSQKTA